MTEDEIDEMFALPIDLEPRTQGVIRSESAPPAKGWDILWDEWSRLTDRPASPIPTAFIKTVRRRIKEGKSVDELMDRVRAATYLTPPSDDSSDTVRVMKCLSNIKVFRQACRERAVEGAERKTFGEHDEAEVLSSMDAVVEISGIPRRRLTRLELSASMSLQMYTQDELREFAFRARQRVGSVVAYPSEMLREAESEMNGEKAQDAHSAVDGSSPDDVLMAADAMATMFHLKGASPNVVRRLHSLAPEGYWNAVLARRDETRKSLNSVYDDLVSEYDWHPSMREAL